MGVAQHVLAWLRTQVDAHYQGNQRVYAELAQLLAALPSLKPSTAVHTSAAGVPELLLRAAGPLPTSVRGATYGIPIELWVPGAYPAAPPIVYVRPTETMVVEPSPVVDRNGRTYFEWNHQCDSLLSVALMLSEAFSLNCPVYAVEPRAQLADPPSVPNDAELLFGQATQGGAAAPPPPEYVQLELPSVDKRRSVTPVASLAARTSAISLLDAPIATPPPPPANPRRGDLLAALKSALEQAQKRVEAQVASEHKQIIRDREKLQHRLRALAAEEKALASASQQCRENGKLLSARTAEARSLTAKASADAPPPAENLVVSSSDTGNKLVSLLATDRAISDLLKALASSLDRERLGVDTFLKHSRSLAREQFAVRHRALNISRDAVFKGIS